MTTQFDLGMSTIDRDCRDRMRRIHWRTALLAAAGLAFAPAVGVVAWLALTW